MNVMVGGPELIAGTCVGRYTHNLWQSARGRHGDGTQVRGPHGRALPTPAPQDEAPGPERLPLRQ
jgi:hypothetical protein